MDALGRDRQDDLAEWRMEGFLRWPLYRLLENCPNDRSQLCCVAVGQAGIECLRVVFSPHYILKALLL